MIKGLVKLSKMRLKDFYLPGLVFETVCPHCQNKVEIDLSDNCPYSIEDSGRCQLSFCCPICDGENNKEMKLKIELSED